MIHMKFQCVPRFKLCVKSDLGGGCYRFFFREPLGIERV